MTSFKKLREIIIFKGGGTPSKKIIEYWNGDIPWATVKDFTSTDLTKTQDYITAEGLRNSSANLIPAGHVIIPTRMSLGKVAINTIDIAINQDLKALIPKIEILSEYLLFAMLALKDEIIKKGAGATVKGITQEALYNMEIPLPPLNDQIRIAHLLGKVEGLIAQRKQHLQQLDELLKSVFLEMFGDPVRNEKGWGKRELGTIFKVRHGFAFKSDFFKDIGHFVLLTPGNFFEEGGFKDRGDRQKFYVGDVPHEYILKKNDLLLAMTEQAPGLLGSTLVVPESLRYLHNQRLGLVRPQEPVQILFLCHLLNQKVIRQIIHSKATGTKVRHTSPTKIESIIVGYPPIGLQNQFAAIVEKVEGIKSRYQQSLADLETLYGALSQKAFKGELDLSRVPLPDDQPSIEQDLAHSPTPEASLAPQPQNTPSVLLDMTDVTALGTISGRQTAITQWLETYLDQVGNDASFSLEHFMVLVNDKLQALEPEQESEIPPLGIADYDQIKDWVFAALAAGKLTQGFDDNQNSVALAKNLPDRGRVS